LERRLRTIDKHYRLLDGNAAILDCVNSGEVTVVSMEDYYPGLRLVLDKPPWFRKEGEIALNLFADNARLYTIAFTMGEEEGRRVLYIGALQGVKTDGIMEVYRQLTHALHGIRPKDFLVISLRLLSGALNVFTLYAISNDRRHHKNDYFGSSHQGKLVTDYDETWLAHGGIVRADGFFEIPAELKYRTSAEIPSRKRAGYRRRYDMLTRLGAQIETACEKHAS
jgi:uncharacterized protein VirK/YbjX